MEHGALFPYRSVAVPVRPISPTHVGRLREVPAITGAHVLTQLQLSLFSGLAFFVMLPYLGRMLTITLNSDWLWRRLLPAAVARLDRLIVAMWVDQWAGS